MASIEDFCDSNIKFIKAQLDFFVVQLISMQTACESISSSIIRRLEEFKQELQNAHFTTFNLEAEFRNVFKELKSTMNALRIEILEEIRSLRKDLLKVKSSDAVRDDAAYAMSPESEDWEDEPRRKRPRNNLIVDRVKQINKNYMRARIADDHVELRCEGVFFQNPVQNQVEEIIQAETSINKTMQELTIQEQGVQDQEMQDLTNRVNISPKKRRAQQSSLARSAEIPRIVLSPNEVAQQSNIEHSTSALQKAGLADFQPSPAAAGIKPATLTRNERRTHGSVGSETPFGSMHRTKVSLGGSETTTDAKRFFDEQWGVQGTMLKIFRCVVKGVPQITVERLAHMGPAKESRQHIAARCFISILKLQHNGFIKVIMDKETNSIKHIQLGPRITKGR